MMHLSSTKLDILYKLWRNRCFGRGHMLIDNVLRGFPRDKLDEFRRDIKELVREGILIMKPTNHGDAVFINPAKRIMIRDLLRKYYEFL
ncbi:MAG: hypothetical protein J7L31_04015 [Thermoplasmata archaeon]|nr:hypothetical protein [Thermoplasmata archaeon]